MRSAIILIGAVLAGCAQSPIVPMGPTETAEGAVAAMWSGKDASEVRSCLDQVLYPFEQDQSGEPVRFDVQALDTPETIYRTRIDIYGETASQDEQVAAAATCL